MSGIRDTIDTQLQIGVVLPDMHLFESDPYTALGIVNSTS